MRKQQTLSHKILYSYLMVAVLIVINFVLFLNFFNQSREMTLHAVTQLTEEIESDSSEITQSIIEFHNKSKRSIVVVSINSVLITVLLGYFLFKGVKLHEESVQHKK